MNVFRVLALGAAVFALGIASVACGGDDDNEKTPTKAPATAGSPASSGAVTVTAKDIKFSPDEIEVSKTSDTKITLKNDDSIQHTLTVYKDEDFKQPIAGADTDRVNASAEGSFTLKSSSFGDADDLYFRCEVHPSQMMGEIKFK